MGANANVRQSAMNSEVACYLLTEGMLLARGLSHLKLKKAELDVGILPGSCFELWFFIVFILLQLVCWLHDRRGGQREATKGEGRDIPG